MKKCRGCAQELAFSEFYENPYGKDGHQNYCKECSKARRRNNRWTGQRNQYKGPGLAQSILPPLKRRTRKCNWIGEAKDNDVAIYVLYGEDEDIFYVGSTTRPGNRLTTHRQRFGKHIILYVFKWVSYEDRCVEEMRWIVKFIDAGYKLMNSGVPSMRIRGM